MFFTYFNVFIYFSPSLNWVRKAQHLKTQTAELRVLSPSSGSLIFPCGQDSTMLAVVLKAIEPPLKNVNENFLRVEDWEVQLKNIRRRGRKRASSGIVGVAWKMSAGSRGSHITSRSYQAWWMFLLRTAQCTWTGASAASSGALGIVPRIWHHQPRLRRDLASTSPPPPTSLPQRA